MQKVLILTTSHGLVGNTGKPTGFYWEELAVPYWALIDAGYMVEFASVKGGMPPADPGSAAPDSRSQLVQRFMDDDRAMTALSHSIAVSDIQADQYAAVFLPGGHGTMWDLSQTKQVGEVVAKIYDGGGIVGAVCHGPAGLLGANLKSGKALVHGKRVNSFTDAEEKAVGLDDVVPFLLETELRQLGAIFEGNEDNFQEYVVRDGRLVTGQNPRSTPKFAQLMLDALGET